MEKMPYQPIGDEHPAVLPAASAVVESGWRAGLPQLVASSVVLRDLRESDAASLFAMLSTAEVSRFISPPPTTIDGFERFIRWTHQRRTAGEYVCFAVVPAGTDSAIGIIQVRSLEPGFTTAEWGFAIGSEYWGGGVFVDAARAVVEFVFRTVGVHRLEARASLANGRGNGALRKLGAVQEGVLRRSFLRHGVYHDQALWSILRDDWSDAAAARTAPRIH